MRIEQWLKMAKNRASLLAALRGGGATTDEAEDAIQEVAACGWNLNAKRPYAYLLAAARRELLRRKRAATRLLTVPLDSGLEPGDNGGIEAVDARVAASQRLASLLGHLKPERASVLLRWTAGEAPRDIAASLGTPRGRIRTWIHRDLETLRRAAGLSAPPTDETESALPASRLRRISEIAGVSLGLTENFLLRTQVSHPEEHVVWLNRSSDTKLAGEVRRWALSILPPDGCDAPDDED